MNTVRTLVVSVALFGTSSFAWDAAGHRAITVAAMEGLPDSVPGWLKDKSTIAQVADQAVVPDRWRGSKIAQLNHLNNPDHYIDLEDLEPFGMTVDSMPLLRYEFVRELTLARERAGKDFKGRPISSARDPLKVNEWPGFLPYGMAEQYGKVQNALKTVRILEKLNQPARDEQLKMARANAMYNMGVLSHLVGDCSQPLHTTRHHHGWEGANPNGYTTDRGIHSYIDGAIVKKHQLDSKAIAEGTTLDATLNPLDPWDDRVESWSRTRGRRLSKSAWWMPRVRSRRCIRSHGSPRNRPSRTSRTFSSTTISTIDR